ncbi:hypothetical protein TTHERM_00578800 (macronuclear) [Tetrahymena thermophila SB210]|uniref:Uncharacterized protein n=1 Tax=Tetrahymena thermophila (strain SB210) TaxID=312017 RepID=I7M380_TETTS|nr:hypothetical protein TTHERM_00578800 [Tetrahymena thermophila SB210]EAS02636.2 hypothetical protein TTHERM_00578800 [Tetrahymena thermophila SB210]|eukprot:XP_001022881.2 hypothetical protein TTHERM_00578800 [Tetrahymena thermophila SB210]
MSQIENQHCSQIELQQKNNEKLEASTIADHNNSFKLEDKNNYNSELSKYSSTTILKNSPTYRDRQRIDSIGQPILKFGKQHKIQFSDNLIDVHIVENWKEYNVLDDEELEQKCNCWLI